MSLWTESIIFYFHNLVTQFCLTTTLPPHDRVRFQLDNDNALEFQLLKVQTENFGESPEPLAADRVLDAACKITTTSTRWKALACLGTYLLRRKVIPIELQKESRQCRVPQGNICNWYTPVFTLSLNATNVNNRSSVLEIFFVFPHRKSASEEHSREISGFPLPQVLARIER